MRRLDIGVLSYNKPDLLEMTLQSIEATAKTDYRIIIVDNASTDPKIGEVLSKWESKERVKIIRFKKNIDYAGGVNEIIKQATTEFVAYSDNDVKVHTVGWDETMCRIMDMFHEVGMVFPGGPYHINRGGYREIMWGIGCFWVFNKLAAFSSVGEFDTNIWHQNEADFCLRLRMSGWKCAMPNEGILIDHKCQATNDPESLSRIRKGVEHFVTKWNKYFNGQTQHYHSINVTRWEDWPPNALYMEEYYKEKFPKLNDNPEVVTVDGRDYDLIKVLRLKGYYRGRII